MKDRYISLDSLSMLLLCCKLEVYKEEPVSFEEWETIERIIQKNGLHGPSSLLGMSQEEFVVMLGISESCASKMAKRIRTMPLFIKALYELETKKIYVMTKYDAIYPKTLRKSMKKRAPLYMFYSGDITVLREGISIAGLTTVDKKERAYVKRLIHKVKDENMMYVSNDTKGTDEVAIRYALKNNCHIAIFVCHDFINKQEQYEKQLKKKQMIILSAVDPLGSFTVTNAIDRNSYICGISKYQIIIASHINNGATWFTALQNMHQKWTVPLVIENDSIGNIRLLDMGAAQIEMADILSNHSFDRIYVKNVRNIGALEVHVDQMSIFEFIGDKDVQAV